MVWPRRGASYLTSIVSQLEEINFDSSIPVTRDVDSEKNVNFDLLGIFRARAYLSLKKCLCKYYTDYL